MIDGGGADIVQQEEQEVSIGKDMNSLTEMFIYFSDKQKLLDYRNRIGTNILDNVLEFQRLNFPLLKFLIEEVGVDVNGNNYLKVGTTVLTQATLFRNKELINYLLDRGADRMLYLPITDQRNLTHWIEEEDDIDFKNFLIEKVQASDKKVSIEEARSAITSSTAGARKKRPFIEE